MSVLSRCIACGSSMWSPFAVAPDRMFDGKKKFYYERCRRCWLIRQNPKLSSTRLKSYYPAKEYYAYQEGISPGLFDRIRLYLLRRYYQPTVFSSIVTKVFPNVPAIPSFVPNGKVLDIGCGTGETLRELKAFGWNVYGLDIDTNAVAIARRKGLLDVSYGSYRNITKFPDRFFDVVRLYHVIEHLDNPDLCLSLIRKKLKIRGKLLIGTPNTGSVVAKFFGSYWYNLDAPRHLILYTPKALSLLLMSHGFSISSVCFCSAGGIVGSLQYFIREKIHHRDIHLLSRPWIVLIVYPVEWMLDKLSVGDIFVMQAFKQKS